MPEDLAEGRPFCRNEWVSSIILVRYGKEESAGSQEVVTPATASTGASLDLARQANADGYRAMKEKDLGQAAKRRMALIGLEQQGIPIERCDDVFLAEAQQQIVVCGRARRKHEAAEVLADPGVEFRHYGSQSWVTNRRVVE
ncbi:MAG: hypothetical protein CAF42_002750 [Nitrospira sp. CG24B]|nr:MAG: hypothetical protein CAF42_002750 [Nitrospira sp. CG24B]